MKTKLLLLVVLFYGSTLMFAQETDQKIDSVQLFALNNNAFMAGEKLVYELKYGFISAGIATLSVDINKLGPDYFYHFKGIAQTVGVKSKLVKIYDVYESYTDVVSGLPIKAIRDINEQSYHKYNELVFNRENNIIYSTNKGKIHVPEGIMDLLGSYFFARQFLFHSDLEKNQTILLNTFFDDEIFPVELRFLQKKKIRTNFGKLEALLFVPIIKKNSPFKDEEDLKIWFSADKNFVPLKMEAAMKFGKVKMKLTSYSGLKNPEKSVLQTK